jgi:transcriptional regulator with XRE-family HTH domain
MPKKLISTADKYPTLVLERCRLWGEVIKSQRLTQRITGAELCQRAQISKNTLGRIERGDPAAAIGAYLSILNVLGMLSVLVPTPPATALPEPVTDTRGRARRVRHTTTGESHDVDYF